jgi:hypothetical protein
MFASFVLAVHCVTEHASPDTFNIMSDNRASPAASTPADSAAPAPAAAAAAASASTGLDHPMADLLAALKEQEEERKKELTACDKALAGLKERAEERMRKRATLMAQVQKNAELVAEADKQLAAALEGIGQVHQRQLEQLERLEKVLQVADKKPAVAAMDAQPTAGESVPVEPGA